MVTSTSAVPVRTTTTSRVFSPAGSLILRGPSPLSSPVPKAKLELVVNTSRIPDHDTPTSKLISYSQIPTYLKDNLYIYTGYRKTTNSTIECLISWTYLHNESVNIFTHLLPAVMILFVVRYVCCTVFPNLYPEATVGDQVVLGIFLGTAVLCFGVSAGFHTLLCHSERVANLWLQLDFLGIIMMIEGGFVSGIYVGFYCEPKVMKLYWGMILTLGLLSGIIVNSPKFQGPRWRTLRLGTFVVTGLSAIAPIAHGISLFGFEQMMKQSGLPYYLLEGVLLVLGAWIYKKRVPESIYPGCFDIWGSSHQIFHVLVILAMGVHFLGIVTAYDYTYSHQRCTVTGHSI